MAHDADLSYLLSSRSSGRSPPTNRRAGVAISVLLAVALALAGCNANQGVYVSAHGAAPGVAASPEFPNYNPYNPITYGQTSGFYAGR